ncbi:metalloregulator ArsR/SmtB family transcription factor [Emcibacter sp. SYSU 3D8]|uniref:ArsR/SmtB family transcription factor n=1 Tax=Emcibacter sp. SYSU 3D8 TaxID=3133969 RepID=UPI0031FF16DE
MELAIQALSALAQDSRLRIFRLLVRQGPDGMAAGDIARELDLPASTLSTHLSVLANAALVRSARHSRSIVYTADMTAMRDLLGFLVEDCCQGRPEFCSPLLDSVVAGCAEPSDCCTPSDNGTVQ